MKPKQIRTFLPKINKSMFIKEKSIKDSFSKRKPTSFEIDISKHRLFRKRIIRLKEQKMKDIIQSSKYTFFSNNVSLSNLSPIKHTTKDDKNDTFFNIEASQNLRRNESENYLNSKESSFIKGYNSTHFKKSKKTEKRYFLNIYRDLKLNYSKYFYIKNDEVFIKYVIDNFVKNKKLSHQLNKQNNNNTTRRIYFIMQNTIVLNYNDIPGIFINIPNYSLLKTYPLEKRQKLYENLLKQLNKKFECKRKINSIFSPTKDIIIDLLDIKREFKYLYVSPTIVCKSISIVISPNFINLYNNDYQDFLLGIKRRDYYMMQKLIERKRNHEFKIRYITKGIKAKYEKLKPHYSFSAGENNIENINYMYYSDDEEKRNKIEKEKNNYLNINDSLKNDFFLYLNEVEAYRKLKPLEDNLNFKTPFKLKESYDNFKIDFRLLLSRFGKEMQKKYGLNPKNFTNENDNNKNLNYDFRDMDNNFDKLFIQKNLEKIKLSNKLNKKHFANVDKKVNKQYSHLVLYNIPKLVPEPDLRKKYFEIFVQFKTLVGMALSMNQNDLVLKNGLDFDTFWHCIPEIQDEQEFFAKKLFAYMNKSNSSLLNLKDFINGMNFIKNSHLGEKIELYLNSLNVTNVNNINFRDAVKISMQAILKNLEGNITFDNSEKTLNDLSFFLASYIFSLVGRDKNKSISVEDLKKFVEKCNEKGSTENNKDLEYIEMFCGV